MESKSILILPASIDTHRAHYIISGGFKYLTKKIRLTDFNLVNRQHKPVYFGPKGVYSLIKSIQFINRQGVVLDSLTNTDYLIFKLLKSSNSVQRDINRYLFQNMCDSVETISPAQVQLTEDAQKQDATKIGCYIDLSFTSDYLMSRNISDDFLTISIEWADQENIEYGYSFSRPPSLYVDEVLTMEAVDANDVVVYNTVIADKIVLYAKNPVLPSNQYQINNLLSTETETRLNSYNQQIVNNMFFYIPRQNANGSIKNLGITNNLALDTRINLITDGVQLLPFSGLDTDAKRMAHLTDANGVMCLPGCGSYYTLSSKVGHFDGIDEVGLFNPNLNLLYSGTHSYSCIGVNKMIVGEIIIQFASKLINDNTTPMFLQTLAEVKRFYKRSTGQTGNLTMSPK